MTFLTQPWSDAMNEMSRSLQSWQAAKSYLKQNTFAQPLIHLVRTARRGKQTLRHKLWLARMARQYSLITRRQFIRDLQLAIKTCSGYAAGKIGLSQQQWMYYEILRSRETDRETISEFETQLKAHALRTGVFPQDPSFCLQFNDFYMPHLKNIDCLGICYSRLEHELIESYGIKNKLIYYPNQEPDRSIPDKEDNCYLQYFRNKKLLLISPFSHLLRERSTKEIFEGVWAKTGKKWFYPDRVDSVEFPYGFTAEGQTRFSTVLELFKFITGEIDKKQFDIALIAAGALAIPIASHVKNTGKIGIDLGGHLQVLFGVIGQRWRQQEEWRENYFNGHWIDMPARYRPREVDAGLRKGDYW